MSEFFLNVVNMSISASYIVIAILLLRLLLKKAPKWITVLLWGVVAVRLVCPFSVESVMSLIPSAETISPEIMTDSTPEINTGISILNNTINPVISQSFTPDPVTSVNPLQIVIPILATVWLFGIAVMLVYTAISFFSLKRKIGTAVLYRENIYQSENVASPFVLGVFSPKIYLPFNMSAQDLEHVVSHEKAHIRRKDHLWKPLGFLLLALHWFNPLMWLGYVFLCRDIELACDEKVIRELSTEQKADYLEALLTCSINRRVISACPLAFGEVGVKSRVKSVLSYKKPTFWIILAAIISSVAVAVCFLTNPKNDLPIGFSSQISQSELDGISLEISSLDASAPDPYIEIKWINDTDKNIIFGYEFYVYYFENGEWVNCSISETPVWHLVAYSAGANAETSKKYKLNGQLMSLIGKYRFEAPFTVDGDNVTEYKAWVEFELEESVAPVAAYTFKATEMVYIDGAYSYVQDAKSAPTFMLANGMQLLVKQKDSIIKQLGAFEEASLNENTFDSRFVSRGLFENEATLKAIKENNDRLWQLYGHEDDETPYLYVLLEQNDGTFYIGEGYYNAGATSPANPDDSHIRWLYKLEKVADDTDASDSAPLSSIDALKKKYLHFFGLPTDNGLTVYTWQMAENSYYATLLPTGNEPPSAFEILSTAATLDEMKEIIADYTKNRGVNVENIEIRAIRMPFSSYWYTIDEKYEKSLRYLFFYNIPIRQSGFSRIIDSARFDIDGDGKYEDCELGYGPTSGVFTFTFSAYEDGELEYYNIFNSPWMQLSFAKNAVGEVMILGVDKNGKEENIGIEIRDGNIALLTDVEGLRYWGKLGIDYYDRRWMKDFGIGESKA